MKRSSGPIGKWLWSQRCSSSLSALAAADVTTATSQYTMRHCQLHSESAGLLRLLTAGAQLSEAASQMAHTRLASTSTAATSSAAQQQQAPFSGSSTPHKAQIIIKAYELRYVQAASATIRDLLLLNCIPKYLSFPTDTTPSDTPQDVWIPIGDAPIPQRLTRYTVNRSPHVDKKSREQFERKVHKRVISVPAIQEHELRWLLDNLKVYEFPGVQIQVNMSSSSYLVPNPTAFTGADDAPVLASHQAKQQAYFDQAATSLAAEASEQQLAARQLDAARGVLAMGYQQLRQQLQELPGYKKFLGSGGMHASSGRSGSSSGLSQDELAQALALTEAFKATLLDLDLSNTDVERRILAELGNVDLANGQDPVEQLYSVAKAAQLQQRLLGSERQAEVSELCRQFVAVSHSVLFKLLSAWAKKNAVAYRQHFALPPEQQVKQMLQQAAESAASAAQKRAVGAAAAAEAAEAVEAAGDDGASAAAEAEAAQPAEVAAGADAAAAAAAGADDTEMVAAADGAADPEAAAGASAEADKADSK